MNENENFVTEVTENVETQTTEETVAQAETPVKTYTEEEVNQIVGKRLARNTAKIRKEYEEKYGDLETVLKAGTGKEDVTEMTEEFRNFYQRKGIQIPKRPTFSDREIEVLARAEADDVISAGFDEVVDEVDRLAKLGENMNAKERAVFMQLATYRKNTEKARELSKIGVTEEVYGSEEFNEFASKFNSNTPVTEIYEIYNKMQPKKEVHTMGSMKNNAPSGNGVKEYYTRDEALKFTVEDLNKNPELMKAIERSMTKW